tara:strand:+ start:285 stop:401 length:117 start_codon:yes stop_codon:yes gene_type:complete
MSDIEIVIAAMGKIAYNFWPILVLMAGTLVWESINNNG